MSDSKRQKRNGALALGYNCKSNAAPKLIAKGFGEIAEKIVRIAQENKIIIHNDQLLFNSLYRLEVGDEIPVKMYQVIAELLAYVYKMNNQYKRGYK